MEVKLISFWFNIENKQKTYDHMIESLNIKHLSYTHDDFNHQVINTEIETKPIYIYQNIDEYSKNLNSKAPLPGDLIEKLRGCESTAFE